MGAIGFYRNDASGALVVVVPKALRGTFDVASLGPLPVEIELKLSDVDPSTLQAANERLAGLARSRSVGESISFYFDPRSERIELVTTIKESTYNAAIGDARELVNFRSGSNVTESRFNDFAPFWGGSALKYQGLTDEVFDCSSGFTMKSGTHKVLVTAAHCGPVDYTVLSPDVGRVIGTTLFGHRYCPTDGDGGSDSNNADVQVIGNSNSSFDNYIYIGGRTGGVGEVNAGPGDPAVGPTNYAVSGAKTYEHTGVRVVSLSGFVSDDACGVPGSLSTMIVYAYVQGNQSSCPTSGGDSGAPFYFKWNTTPASIGIRGMHIGRSLPQPTGTVCFAMRYNKIASVTGYSALTQ